MGLTSTLLAPLSPSVSGANQNLHSEAASRCELVTHIGLKGTYPLQRHNVSAPFCQGSVSGAQWEAEQLHSINLSSYCKCSLHQGNQYHFFPPIPLIKPWLISCHTEVCRNMHENFIYQLQGNGLRGSRELTKEKKKKLATLFKRRIVPTKAKITSC